MTATRQRLGLRSSWKIAMSTVGVWSGGVLPFAHALYWWVRGVPLDKVEQAARGSSRWERMTPNERRLYVGVTGACVLVVAAAAVVVGFTSSR